MRLEFLLKCEPEKSSDKRVFGQMTEGSKYRSEVTISQIAKAGRVWQN